MKKVLVPLAPGCEELEAVTLMDILRRGGVQVVAAGTVNGPIKASRGVVLLADMPLSQALQIADFDMVVIPGGMEGARTLMECEPFVEYVSQMAQRGRLVGAICAAPMILGKAGLLDGRKFTAYPGVMDAHQHPGAVYTGGPVESDRKVMTLRGPGTALDFALEILDELMGKDVRVSVENQLVRS